ncbi:flagellar hook-length control protein FliK [Neptunomonas japonica]|uniref:flagellar hook-length control protein FliK n=1 Tax=Neptunomonas japonica TaxID=417574 RepID=UPI0003FF3EBD|nr:flagellar hook-length control protein FliK [Neptunomonas japonica]
MNTITPQSLSLLDSSGNTRTGSAEKLIPAGGSLQATVRQVSQDQLSPNVFRLKLESNSVLMELKAQQPITAGSKVLISRTNDGQLAIKLATTTTADKPVATTPSLPLADKASTTRTYQTPVIPVIRSEKDVTTLANTIPRGQTINAQVTSQTQGLPITSSQTAAPQTNPTPSRQQPAPPQATTPATTISTSTTMANTPLPAVSTQAKPTQPATPQPSTPQTSQLTTEPVKAATTAAPAAQVQVIPIQGKNVSAQTNPQTAAQHTQPTTQQTNTQSPPPALPNTTPTKYSTEQAVNILTLNVKGATVTLQTTANLPPLQQIQVSRNHTDQISISWTQPIPIDKAGTATSQLTPQQATSLQNSLREQLPQQISLGAGIQQLLNSSVASNSAAAGQIDKVVQSLMQLFGVRPGTAEAQQTIKQNINYGGLFTENKLANNQSSPKDMKQFLGKLQALAEQLPDSQKQLIQSTVDKILARVTTNQLTSLQSRQERIESNERFFQLDLPIRNQETLDNVELRISHRSQQNSRQELETIWKVRLHFDLDTSRSIDAELSLNQEQSELTAAFTCSHHDTVTSIKSQLNDFREQLSTLGLNVPTLICKQGKPQPQKAPIQKQLIDIKT